MAEAISTSLLLIARQILIITRTATAKYSGKYEHQVSYISACTEVDYRSPVQKVHQNFAVISVDSFTILKGTYVLSLLDHFITR